jgi:hypothetical protein
MEEYENNNTYIVNMREEKMLKEYPDGKIVIFLQPKKWS